jgi:hypothetical protein|tara:strand:- start:323 stop:454 length:132 start_codon:yes stop_codon:yes gene_type:complete
VSDFGMSTRTASVTVKPDWTEQDIQSLKKFLEALLKRKAAKNE